MPDKNIEINKLKIIKANLLKELTDDYDKRNEGVLSFDYMLLINEYCNHQCDIGTPYSKRAYDIVTLEQDIDWKLGIIQLPRARISLQYVNYLIDSGKIQTESQIEKTSTFLAIIQKILSVDKITTEDEIRAQETKEEENEKLALLIELLDPWVLEHSFEQFKNGQYRDAVLNSFIALGDLLRDKTGVPLDGSALATSVLSLKNPKIILSDIDTDSGINDQIGFMQILQGSFTGIRNPKAHSIRHDLNENKTIQYLVLASLLARRINEGTINT